MTSTMPTTNISLYLESIRSTKAPYYCPYEDCARSFRKIPSLEMHLNSVDHSVENFQKKIPSNNSGKDNEKTPVTRKSTPDVKTSTKSSKIIQFKYNDQLETMPAHTKMAVEVIPLPNSGSGESAANVEEKSLSKKSRLSHKSKARPSTTANKSFPGMELKLPEPSYRLINSHDNEYKDPTDSTAAYYRFLDDSIEEEDQIKVEYDMDEEDSVWLDLINKKRRDDRLLDVPVETFELMMDRFEKESFFQSQSNGTDLNSAIDEDAVCSICFDGECHNSNAILFCDMCNIAVHQECYGVPYIPEGLWLCRRCLRSPSCSVDCVLCPNKGGAFKHTDDNRWAHVICALWIPEVGFSNSVFLEPVDSISAIPASRWRLVCSICRQKNVGACIQCYKSNCYTAFHVTCAQQAGLYMKIEAVKEVTPQGRVVMNIKKSAYCLNHAPVSKNGRSNGLYLSGDEDSKGETPVKSEKIRTKMKNARKILAEKRTSTSNVSIPTIPNERLSKIAELVSFPRRNEFLIRLYAYWKLKRQSRGGVPLLRRLQYTNSIMRIDLNKEKSKRDFLKIRNQYKKLMQLRRDLERSRLLLELVRKRERIKLKIIRESRTIYTYQLVPFKMFLLHLLDKIVEKDTNQFFLEPVNTDEVADYLTFIKNPMDLGTMRKKAEDLLYTSFEQFENDLNLIVDNCMYYNEKDTIWYKAAVKLKGHIDHILDENRHFLANYDQKSGLHVTDVPETENSKSNAQEKEIITNEIEEC